MYQCFFVLSAILIGISSAEDCSLSVFPPDPGSGCCGLANGNSTRKSVTSAADINEYPWMALKEYKKEDKIKLICSAILISGRYTLTAAVCFSPEAFKVGGNPFGVRIEEYDKTNEGKDCVEVETGEICNDGAISVPIELTTPHPGYRVKSRQNDIALIRLAETVPYTEFIRPICLPTSDLTLQPPEKFYMTVAGWGASNSMNKTRSSILRRVKVPFVKFEVCAEKYLAPVLVTNKQLCAGSKNRDTCSGDAGGPLMYFNGHTTELVGIVSYGPRRCGSGVPGVYTKVFEYMNWIRSVIEEDSKTFSPSVPDADVIHFRD